MSSPFKVPEAFAPRRTRFDGVREHNGWQIKTYSILYGENPFEPHLFDGGIRAAIAALPSPAETEERPGVAVLISHQGCGVNCTVLSWWDRTNELPIRVFVDEGKGWRPSQGAESICVWDMDVLWAERQAYVEHVLSKPGAPDMECYLVAGALLPN